MCEYEFCIPRAFIPLPIVSRVGNKKNRSVLLTYIHSIRYGPVFHIIRPIRMLCIQIGVTDGFFGF